MSWTTCKLGDVLTFQRGHDLPKTSMLDGKYPVVGSNGIIGYHNQYTTEGPSVSIGRSGNVGNPFIYYGKSWSHNTTLYVKDFKGNNPVYVYYLLKTLNLGNYAGGSAVPSLNRNHIHGLPVTITTDRIEQEKIASLLESIDEKINYNNQINDNLQQQAQAIYHQYFETVNSSTWTKGHLSDLIVVKYGKDHKKLTDGDVPVYGSGGLMRHVERCLYTGESVLIPRKGTLNNVMYVNEAFWTVDTMFYTEMRIPNVAKFVYHFVSSKNLASMNAGSAVPSMTTDILNAIEVAIPPTERLADFNSVVAPMYMAMQENARQSKKLEELRDVLLPRLMSGELDVSAIDI